MAIITKHNLDTCSPSISTVVIGYSTFSRDIYTSLRRILPHLHRYRTIALQMSRLHLTEERVAKTDGHSLDLGVVVQRSLTKLTANARLLVSTKGKLPVKRVVRVHPYSSRTERVRNLNSRVEVGRVYGSSEAVGRVVANRDGVLLGFELGDGADRAEDLFLHNLHVFGNVGEDGGLDEVTLVTDALATCLDLGASLLALFDVAVKMLARVEQFGGIVSHLMMRSNCNCETWGPWKVSCWNGSPTAFFSARALNLSMNLSYIDSWTYTREPAQQHCPWLK
jgi:hypothetical protein